MNENNQPGAQRIHCPSCSYNTTLYYACDKNETVPDKVDVLCNICQKGLSDLELINRRLEVMDGASPSDFPKFIRHLVKYLLEPRK